MLRLPSICLFVLPVLASAGGVIEGRVVLSGAPTVTVVSPRYTILNQAGIVSTSPPLAVVYLEGTFPAPAELPVAQLPQKDLAFQPALLAIRTGTRVEFPNLDDTYHNIFSFSAPKRFDLGRYRRDEKPVPAQVFDVPGLVTLRCDIHEHMRGLILVLDTPFFVVTDQDGRFRLEGLPSGHFHLKAWINSRTTLDREVDLADGAVLHIDFP